MDASKRRPVITWWAILGLVALIADGVVRMAPRAATALTHPELGIEHFVFGALWVPTIFHLEGVRGFQRSFAPRCAARAAALGRGTPAWLVVLAPFVCAGLVHATRRRLAGSWGVVLGVVVLVVAVGHLPQPWRGLVDLGVVVALTWGALRLVVDTYTALCGTSRPVELDFPRDSPVATPASSP